MLTTRYATSVLFDGVFGEAGVLYFKAIKPDSSLKYFATFLCNPKPDGHHFWMLCWLKTWSRRGT